MRITLVPSEPHDTPSRRLPLQFTSPGFETIPSDNGTTVLIALADEYSNRGFFRNSHETSLQCSRDHISEANQISRQRSRSKCWRSRANFTRSRQIKALYGK
jgi:hypothetical protein